ncbi:hypothetical protein H2201_000371 [Coniosporium apollinis]|uniref:Tyrosinase copper-binding domain-containing protein n=1 Tax=Coniosporium apollinis TaxID=61459 RepID=A0ABQ9P4J6_9PEZI|nr:hypothetical protein H2201_000371 [Coniosporium apollinis]
MEKRNYIDAILCLSEKPGKTPPEDYPGVRNRYDDFVAIHMNQTFFIHSTANFLSWHRYYIWIYEKALREECGYKGYLPYYNYAKYASDPLQSPLFDGSDTSISGNGAYVNHTGLDIPNALVPHVHIPPGPGGGCITSGPFANWTVNLGPVANVLPYVEQNPDPAGLGRYYNPRCLRRDISAFVSAGWAKDQDIVDLINDYTDILSFQNRLQGEFSVGYLGVHSAGHFMVGGDPGGDFFTSPGDPWFFLHHAMIDRIWWTWQNLEVEERTFQVGGTITFLNNPPSRNGTLDDVLDLGVNGGPVTMREAMSSVGGPFCYIYV